MEQKSKKKRAVSLIGSFVILLVLVHTSIYFFSQTTVTPGIAGRTILGDIVDNYEQMSLQTRLIITVEWLAVIVIVLFFLIKGKMAAGKEAKIGESVSMQSRKMQYAKSRSKTDLDILYDIVREKKMLRTETIAHIFNVPEKTAMEWSKILEDGNLVTIQYPTVGSPKIVLKEAKKEVNHEKEAGTAKPRTR